jgi:hypothetical protein
MYTIQEQICASPEVADLDDFDQDGEDTKSECEGFESDSDKEDLDGKYSKKNLQVLACYTEETNAEYLLAFEGSDCVCLEENRKNVEILFAKRECWRLATPVRYLLCMVRSVQIQHRVIKGMAYQTALQDITSDNAFFDLNCFIFSRTSPEINKEENRRILFSKISWNKDFCQEIIETCKTQQFVQAREQACTASKLDACKLLPRPITCEKHDQHVSMMGKLVSVLAAIRQINGEKSAVNAFYLVMNSGGMVGAHFFG